LFSKLLKVYFGMVENLVWVRLGFRVAFGLVQGLCRAGLGFVVVFFLRSVYALLRAS